MDGDHREPAFEGYWAPVVRPIRPTPPPAPRLKGSTGTALSLIASAVVVVCSLLAVVGQRAQAAAQLEVLAGLDGVPASAGWGPTHVDDQGRPGRWDPCAPIHYVVQPGWMPETGRRDLAAALERLSLASGLFFVDDGDTTEMPSSHRSAYQPSRYGDRWAPVLIGWYPPATTDLELGNGVQGLSVSIAVPNREGPSLVTGQVLLDADHRLPGGFGPGVTDGEVLLHELTHAVGLGHVLDPTQVMYPQTTKGESEYGAGDRAGLAAVGSQAGCHAAPRARQVHLGEG